MAGPAISALHALSPITSKSSGGESRVDQSGCAGWLIREPPKPIQTLDFSKSHIEWPH